MLRRVKAQMARPKKVSPKTPSTVPTAIDTTCDDPLFAGRDEVVATVAALVVLDDELLLLCVAAAIIGAFWLESPGVYLVAKWSILKIYRK